jgi:hypothetical protein
MREYDCPFGSTGGTAETVACDLVEITPADDKGIFILSCEVYQVSDFGDSQAEIIPVFWVRGFTSSGSGGVAAANGNACNPSDATSGFTYEALNTTAATTGTTKQLKSAAWNVQAGLLRIYIPEERVEVSQANTTLIWRMGAAPADSLTIIGNVCVGESG